MTKPLPTETNADLGTRLYRAVTSRDDATARTLLAPDLTLHVPGTHTGAGDHIGADAVLAFMTASASTTDAGVSTDVLDLMAGRDHVAVHCRVRARRSDAVLDNHTIHLLRIENGTVTDVWLHNRDQAAVDAFWSSADTETEVSAVPGASDGTYVGLGDARARVGGAA